MGVEQIDKRRRNQCAVLKALHYGGTLHRSQIGVEHGIRKSSITSIVGELIEIGIVRELRPGSIRSPIELDRQRYHAVVASVTPRDCRFARVFLDGRVEETRRVSIKRGRDPSRIVDILADGFSLLLSENGMVPMALGVALQGAVDPGRGVAIHCAHLDGWKNIPLGRLLSERTGHAVYVENDVRCQLWSSMWFDRLARESDNTIYVNIHDGVACSLIMHGRRIIGEHAAAGEIGHVRVGDEGRVCECGRRDCLETYCSIPALLEAVRQSLPTAPVHTAADIVRAVQDHPEAAAVIDRALRRLARALAGVVALVDPHTVLIGTPDRAFSLLLQDELTQHVYTELIGLNASDAAVVLAEEVEISSLKGVAGLVIERAFDSGRLTLEGGTSVAG